MNDMLRENSFAGKGQIGPSSGIVVTLFAVVKNIMYVRNEMLVPLYQQAKQNPVVARLV